MSTDLLERAFQLADSGRCASVTDIRRTLARDRYDHIDAHLAGTGLKKQLLERIGKARYKAADKPELRLDERADR